MGRWSQHPDRTLYDLYIGVMAWRGSDFSVAGEERSIEQLGKCYIDRIIVRQRCAEFPDARKQEVMRIAIQPKAAEIIEGFLPPRCEVIVLSRT